MKDDRDGYPDLIWTTEDAKKVKYVAGFGFTFIASWIIFLLVILAPSCPNPRTAEDCFSYGQNAMGQNDFIQAQRWFTKAIEKNPRYFEAYEQRVRAWEKTDSLHNAINDYDTLLTFKNITVDKTAELIFLKANNYYLLSQDSLACHSWRKACDLNHNKSCDFIRKRCK